MTAETILMKLFAIPERNREDVREVLENTRDDMLDFSLSLLSQWPDDEDFDEELDTWAETYFEGFLKEYAYRS